MQFFGRTITISKREEHGSPTGSSEAAKSADAKGQDVHGHITYAQSPDSALSVSAYHRAITLRADTMARLTMQYQKWLNGCYTEDKGPTRGRHLNYLLQVEPNPFTSWTTLMRGAMQSIDQKGNAFIYVHRGLDGEVIALYLCSSGSYNVVSDSYTITYYVGNFPQTLTDVPSRDILHVRATITTPDGLYGVSILHHAARTLNLAATQDQLTLETYAKGGRHKLILQEEKTQNMGLGKTPRKEMEKVREQAQEDLPNNDVLYIPNVANVNNITQTMSELELSTCRKLSVADISRFTGVPRTLLGDDTNSTYKTPEAATLDFLNNGIAPLIEAFEDEFNRKLLGEAGYGLHRFHLCADKLFRLDRQAQGQWNKNRLETGVASVNELRAEMELEPIPGGDVHLVSANYVELGSPKLTGKAEPTPAPAPKEGGES